MYDLRTNKHFTLKQNTLTRTDLDEFVACYRPGERHKRTPSWSEKSPEERWRSFTYDELVARDKASLDLFWLRDESLEDSASLPDPHVLAGEIAEDLRSALEQIESTEFTFFNGHYDTWCYLPIVATVTFNDETAQFAVASWSSTSWRKLEPGSCTAIHISPGKVVSLFEPHTEIIRKGKLAKPTEFGRVVKIQEAEAQFIADYAVCDSRQPDRALWEPALDRHRISTA